MRRRALLLLVTLFAPLAARPAATQTLDSERILARADAALQAGDTARARAGYAQVRNLDPYQSRAVYQLGRIEPPGSREQIRLFRRYTELEPDDAWGFAALGNAYRDAGATENARAAYRRGLAIAPDAADIRQALEGLHEPARRRSFSVVPLVRASGDSDGSRSSQIGASARVALGIDATVSFGAARLALEDALGTVSGWTATVEARARPLRPLLLTGQAGLVSVEDALTGTAIQQPLAQARMRWRPEHGVALELRVQHGPLMATPGLLAAPVVRSEVRGTAELPVAGPVYARAVGRYGALRSPGAAIQTGPGGSGMGRPGWGGGGATASAVTNTRAMIGGGSVLRLLPGLEVSALAARSGYADSAAAGYFAPERVDILDTGIYWEHERGPFAIALDTGGGLERVKPFDAGRGEWGRALRLWSQIFWALGPAAALRVELEGYDTQGGEAVITNTGGWQWWSVGAALVLRP